MSFLWCPKIDCWVTDANRLLGITVQNVFMCVCPSIRHRTGKWNAVRVPLQSLSFTDLYPISSFVNSNWEVEFMLGSMGLLTSYDLKYVMIVCAEDSLKRWTCLALLKVDAYQTASTLNIHFQMSEHTSAIHFWRGVLHLALRPTTLPVLWKL